MKNGLWRNKTVYGTLLLTRASHRVYALLQDTDGKSVSGLAFWKNRAEPFQHRCCTDEIILEQPPAARHLNQHINIIEIQAQHFS